jgi:LmbE family N-acetylglucosaminyl deacetylase
MKIVIVSPHRDDAAFSLSLAIGAWLEAGHSVAVVNCFTRSEYAPYSDVDSLHPNDRRSYVTALRLREDEAWCRHFGPHLTHADLNLKDAPLRLRCGIDEVCSTPVRHGDKALLKIAQAIEAMTPEVLVLPLALGRHVDHMTARDAVLSLCSIERLCAFYEDLPYATRPGEADQIVDLAQSLALDLKPVFTAAPRDLDDAAKWKRQLALSYDSQIDEEVTTQIAEFCRRYEGRERLWANAAWQASTLTSEGAA